MPLISNSFISWVESILFNNWALTACAFCSRSTETNLNRVNSCISRVSVRCCRNLTFNCYIFLCFIIQESSFCDSNISRNVRWIYDNWVCFKSFGSATLTVLNYHLVITYAIESTLSILTEYF